MADLLSSDQHARNPCAESGKPSPSASASPSFAQSGRSPDGWGRDRRSHSFTHPLNHRSIYPHRFIPCPPLPSTGSSIHAPPHTHAWGVIRRGATLHSLDHPPGAVYTASWGGIPPSISTVLSLCIYLVISPSLTHSSTLTYTPPTTPPPTLTHSLPRTPIRHSLFIFALRFTSSYPSSPPIYRGVRVPMHPGVLFLLC